MAIARSAARSASVGAIFGEHHFGIDARLRQAGDEPRRERIGAAQSLDRKCMRRRAAVGSELELLLECRGHREARARLEIGERAPEEGARAGAPRRAVKFDNVAQDKIERRRRAGASRAIARGKIGEDAKIAARTPRVRIGDRIEGVSEILAGTQPIPAGAAPSSASTKTGRPRVTAAKSVVAMVTSGR
jgi:hypothetical protein